MRKFFTLTLRVIVGTSIFGVGFIHNIWAVSPVAPFTGEFGEGFESFVLGDMPGSDPGRSGPFCVIGGQAALSATSGFRSAPLFVWSDFSLGSNGSAVPFDGKKGLGLRTSGNQNSMARLDFQTTVTDFGGYWVHASTPEPVAVSFFDTFDQLIATEHFNYASSLGGISQWFGWTSDIPIKAVELNGFWVGIDGVQINTEGEPVDDTFCRDFGDPVTIDMDATIDQDHSFPESGINVVNGPNRPTTVRLVHGGVIAIDFHSASHIRGASALDIMGGTVGGVINVYDTGKVNVTGGEFLFDPYTVRTVRVSAPPTDMAAIVARDSSTVRVSAGRMEMFDATSLLAFDTSHAMISGGTLYMQIWTGQSIRKT